MRRFVILLAVLAVLPASAATAGQITISNTDFGDSTKVGAANGTYVPGTPGYMHLAYTDGSNAVVGAKGPFGTLAGLSMSFDYSNLIGGNGNLPYAAFGVSENSSWNYSAQEFLIIAMSGTEINSDTLVHVVNVNTGANYIPMSGAITLGQLLGETYNGFAFGDMNVLRAYAYIGNWPSVGSTSVDIDSITVSSVPDPGSALLLLGMSVAGLGALRRKFRR